MRHYDMKTYNRMPLSSFSEIDQVVGKDYSGDFLVRYDASQWINMNKLADNVEHLLNESITSESADIAWIKANLQALLDRVVTLENQNKDLLDQNYELEQRLDAFEMSSGEN